MPPQTVPCLGYVQQWEIQQPSLVECYSGTLTVHCMEAHSFMGLR